MWWDFDLVGGEQFRDAIQVELDKAAVVVVIWSEHSVRSRWVLDEADHAAAAGKLAAVRTAGVAFRDIPLGFRGYQTDLVTEEERVLHALGRLGVVVRDPLPEQATAIPPPHAEGRLDRAILSALTPLLVVGLFFMWWWSSAQYVKTLYVAVLAYGALAIGSLTYFLERRRSSRAWSPSPDSAFYAMLLTLGCAWALAALACSYGGDIGQFSTTATAIAAVLVFAALSVGMLRGGKSWWIVPFQTVSLVIGCIALFLSVRLLAISGVVREDVRYGVYHNVMTYGGLAFFVIGATHAFGRARDILEVDAPVRGHADHLPTQTPRMAVWLATFAGAVDGAVVMSIGYTAFQGSPFGIHQATFLAGGAGLLVAAMGAVLGHRFAEHVAWGAAATLALGSLYAAIFNVVRLGRLGLGMSEIVFLAVTILGIPVLLGSVLTARRRGS